MKIVNENTKESIYFEDIKIGEVFKYDKCYYMKIQDIPYMDDGEESYYNAINLVNGDAIEFAGYIIIEPLNAELIIK